MRFERAARLGARGRGGGLSGAMACCAGVVVVLLDGWEVFFLLQFFCAVAVAIKMARGRQFGLLKYKTLARKQVNLL